MSEAAAPVRLRRLGSCEASHTVQHDGVRGGTYPCVLYVRHLGSHVDHRGDKWDAKKPTAPVEVVRSGPTCAVCDQGFRGLDPINKLCMENALREARAERDEARRAALLLFEAVPRGYSESIATHIKVKRYRKELADNR